jgi:transcriptional regulator with XRE-family HTH domain
MKTAEEYQRKTGLRLKELRIKAGYTNSEYFAHEHELHKRTVSKAEKGGNINTDTLFRILLALRVSPEEFFKGIK